MQMQEPEQWQQSRQEEHASQQYNEYSENYTDKYEPEQQQKVYPRREQMLPGTVLRIIAIILSSLGFFLSLAGIIVSAIVLKYAHGHEGWLAGGVVGLVASILVLIICVAIFVIAVVTLALRMRRIGINNRRDNNKYE